MNTKRLLAKEANARKRINSANKIIRRAKKQLIKQLGKEISKKYKVSTLKEFEQKYKIIPKN